MLNIEKHAASAHLFLNEVAEKMGIPEEKEKAGRILASILHALRNRLTPEESMHFISQLPLFIKGVYVDGWRIGEERHRIHHIDQFIQEIKENEQFAAKGDFPTKQNAINYIKAVFTVVRNHISEGQAEHIKTLLPKELREFWSELEPHQ